MLKNQSADNQSPIIYQFKIQSPAGYHPGNDTKFSPLLYFQIKSESLKQSKIVL